MNESLNHAEHKDSEETLENTNLIFVKKISIVVAWGKVDREQLQEVILWGDENVLHPIWGVSSTGILIQTHWGMHLKSVNFTICKLQQQSCSYFKKKCYPNSLSGYIHSHHFNSTNKVFFFWFIMYLSIPLSSELKNQHM